MNKFLVKLGLLAAVAASIAMISCKQSTDDGDIPVKSVTLNEGAATLAIGETLDLVATVLPAEATNRAVSWSSDKGEVAAVDGGRVTANRSEMSIVTVTLGENLTQLNAT